MKNTAKIKSQFGVFLPTLAVFALLGVWGLSLQAKQSRDTIRKHHLEDLEQALMDTARERGSYPPYTSSSWCGLISDPKNKEIKEVIEKSLRENKEYAKPDKPFPEDPAYKEERGYFYWKTSPASFELMSELEADPNNSVDVSACGHGTRYDYSIASNLRSKF